MKEELTFNGQRPGEKVLEAILGHPYILYLPALKAMMLLVLAVAMFLFFPVLNIVGIVLVVFAVIYLIRAIYCFKESLFIITDQRLFIVNQVGFFRRKVTEIDLYKILDITSETGGFAKTILKYGDLVIRTAGAQEGGGLVIKNIPDPYSVEQRIAGLDGIHGHKN